MNKHIPLSILLVEDDAGTREILAGVLALKFPKFVIHTADNGKTALKCYRKYLSAIVITDINMPVMDGISMVKEIKAINADVKLIILTAFSDKNVLADAVALEIEHYIPKPTDYGKLFAAIEQCIAGIEADGVLTVRPRGYDEKTNDAITVKDDLEVVGIVRGLDGVAHPAVEIPSSMPGANTNMRVLLVEDNILIREATGSLLELYGYEVQLADSGTSAITLLEAFRPEVVLLDIGLPDVNGYQVARQIRSLPGGSELLLVAISGYGQAEDLARSKVAGFDHHLLKPFVFAPLRDLLAARAQSMG